MAVCSAKIVFPTVGLARGDFSFSTVLRPSRWPDVIIFEQIFSKPFGFLCGKEFLMSETLHGEVTAIIYPKDGMFFDKYSWTKFIIYVPDKNQNVTCIGYSLVLYKKKPVVVTGDFGKDKTGADVFNASDIYRDDAVGVSDAEMVKFICGNGLGLRVIEGCGNAKAALYAIENHPEWLYKIKGIKDTKIKAILANYAKNAAVEKAYNELKNYGFSIKDTVRVVKAMGSDSLELIKENPYCLFFKAGFGFKSCDEIAIRQGFPLSCRARTICGLLGALRENTICGNTFMHREDLIKKSIVILQQDDYTPSVTDVVECLDESVKKGRLVEKGNDVYTKRSYQEECDIRSFVLNAIGKPASLLADDSAIAEYESKKGITFGPEQIQAIKNSLSNKISVITGGPGTGKTTILDCILKIASKSMDMSSIALCAPTGKAARRMSEATGLPASTIHAFLKVDPEKPNLDTFQYNSDHQLPYRLIVIDESSMIDQFILASLFRAMKAETQVIFVGDIQQLSPVGAGYSLRDLIAANVPTVRLLATYRQSGDSTIIKLSKQIRDGQLSNVSNVKKDFGFTPLSDSDGNDLSPEDGVKKIVDIYLRGYAAVGVANIIILTPQNKEAYGTKSLNLAILNRLIPDASHEVTRNGWKFRPGCRVIQVRNNNKLGIVNGQIGTMDSVDFETKTAVIDFDGIKYDYTSEMFDDLALGYAITVHKSQGSEWAYVIEIVSKTSHMNTRPLVYTGITRAKKKLIIIGDLGTLIECPHRVPPAILSRIV